MNLRRFVITNVLAATLSVAAVPGFADTTANTLRLLSGQPEGSYYEISARLSQQVNANTYDHGLMIFTEATRGSVDTALWTGLGAGDLGIVQMDVLEDLVAGRSAATAHAPLPLQSLFVVDEEYMLVVVRDTIAPATLSSLPPRRLAIGTGGSGTQFTAKRVLPALGVPLTGKTIDSRSAISLRADRFCRGEIDAAVFVISLPNPVVSRTIGDCGGVVLGISDPDRQALERILPSYQFTAAADATLPASKVKSQWLLRVPAVVVTSTLPDDQAALLLTSVFDPPDLGLLRRIEFRNQPLTNPMPHGATPIHPAAEKFFLERPDLTGSSDKTEGKAVN